MSHNRGRGFGLAIGTMITGCMYVTPVTRFEASVKTAWQMYTDRAESLGPPPIQREQHVYARGKAKFVEDMVAGLNTKYRCEALYCLGWFGDRRHAGVVAPSLTANDPEVRRIALHSFSLLTHTSFSSAEEATQWWAENKESFPRWDPRTKGQR